MKPMILPQLVTITLATLIVVLAALTAFISAVAPTTTTWELQATHIPSGEFVRVDHNLNFNDCNEGVEFRNNNWGSNILFECVPSKGETF